MVAGCKRFLKNPAATAVLARAAGGSPLFGLMPPLSFRDLSLLAMTGFVAAGCGLGGRSAHVSGQVTLKGKPLPEAAQAFITFASDADPKASVSAPIAAGHYDAPNTPVGPCHVFFEITTTGPEKMSERTGQPYRDIINHVPDRYAEGIPLDVTGDLPSQDFDLAD
jgi:hypothetical protein